MRRSFFLFVITVRNSPCNFKGDVNCPAEKREQKHDLFKRHGASPLSALKQSGENEIPNEKIRSYPATQGTGKEQPPAFVGTAPDGQLCSRHE